MADELLMQTRYVLVVLAGVLESQVEAQKVRANRLPSGRPMITVVLAPTTAAVYRMACTALGPGLEPLRMRVPAKDGTRGMAASWMLELPNSTVILNGTLTD